DQQARDVEARQDAAAADDQHWRRDVGADASSLEQDSSAAGDHVAELAYATARQRVQFIKAATHHLTYDRQRRRFAHAVHDRARQRARDADDGGHFARLEVALFDPYLTTPDVSAKLLLENTFCSK